jgi:O-antigen ligase
MTAGGTTPDTLSRPRPLLGPDLPLVVVGVAAAAAAPLLGLTPLLVGAALFLCAVAVALIARPRLAMQAAVVTVLLPAGLLPAGAQRYAELATLLVALAAPGAESRRYRLPLVVGWSVAVMACFLLWALLTATWSAAPGASLVQLRPYVLSFLLLLLIVNVVRRREDVPSLMNALALSGWLLLSCSGWALLTGGYASGERLVVLDLNANQLGNVLLVTTAGVLWRQLWSPGGAPGRWRSLETVLFLSSSLLVIALTGSRGSLAAFAVLLLSFGLTRPLRTWAAAGVVLSLALLAAFPGAFTTVLSRIEHPDPNQLSRVQLWRSGLALVADHPFGVGLGQGPVVLPDYVNAQVSTDHFTARDTIPAHNALIEVADDTGLVGAALFGSAMVLAAGTCVAAIRRARLLGDRPLITYGAVVGTTSIAFLIGWGKSGGESYNVTTFLLLALWLAPARAGLTPGGRRQPVA